MTFFFVSFSFTQFRKPPESTMRSGIFRDFAARRLAPASCGFRPNQSRCSSGTGTGRRGRREPGVRGTTTLKPSQSEGSLRYGKENILSFVGSSKYNPIVSRLSKPGSSISRNLLFVSRSRNLEKATLIFFLVFLAGFRILPKLL